MITFTSFERSHKHKGQKFSIACFQPKGFNYDELTCLAPFTEDFRSLRSREFLSKDEELCDFERYEQAFNLFSKTIYRAYLARWSEIYYWLQSLHAERDLVLCCWCPESKAAQDQLKKVGVFVCHCGLVAKMVQEYRKDIEIFYDKTFREMETSPWDDFDLPTGQQIQNLLNCCGPEQEIVAA